MIISFKINTDKGLQKAIKATYDRDECKQYSVKYIH